MGIDAFSKINPVNNPKGTVILMKAFEAYKTTIDNDKSLYAVAHRNI